MSMRMMLTMLGMLVVLIVVVLIWAVETPGGPRGYRAKAGPGRNFLFIRPNLKIYFVIYTEIFIYQLKFSDARFLK